MGNKSSTISSVENAINILLTLQKDNRKSIRELSEELSIPKSTLHRTIQTMESKGFVRQDVFSEKYTLGFKILELSESLRKDIEIRNLAYEYMKELRDRTGDTVQLAILDDESILIVETVDGTNELRVFSRPGKKHPITYGNFGRVFLSSFTTQEVEDYIKKYPLKRYASNSIIDKQQFLDKVNKVRDLGISTSINDPIEGAFTIAAPIYDSLGSMIASIAISGVMTSTHRNTSELQQLLKIYADKISNECKG